MHTRAHTQPYHRPYVGSNTALHGRARTISGSHTAACKHASACAHAVADMNGCCTAPCRATTSTQPSMCVLSLPCPFPPHPPTRTHLRARRLPAPAPRRPSGAAAALDCSAQAALRCGQRTAGDHACRVFQGERTRAHACLCVEGRRGRWIWLYRVRQSWVSSVCELGLACQWGIAC